MTKQFYSHLIEIDSLIIEFKFLDLTSDQKLHLIGIIYSSLHHAILDAVLSQLSEKDKKLFLTHVLFDDHGRVWELLNRKIENVEDKIKKTAEVLKDELKKDIRQVHKEKKYIF